VERHQAIRFSDVRLPDDSLPMVDIREMMGYQHFPQVSHVVQRVPSNQVVVNHTIEGEWAGAMVHHHAEIRGIGFRSCVMPGRRSVPKEVEKHPFSISMSCWSRKNAAFFLSRGVGLALS